MSAPISTRTRQRNSAPLLTLSTALTHASRIGKRTPISRSRLRASPAPSTASGSRSATSSVSLLSALSFATNATTPSSPRTAAKAIVAACGPASPCSSLRGSATSAAAVGAKGKSRQPIRTKRTLLWPSQIYAQSARSQSPEDGEGNRLHALGGYLRLLQGTLSGPGSARGGSASPSPDLDRA
ncbi:MAG: hypothetical protein MMC23_006174 [Stictis urceolatum]|nr:hypothetical protein [Stictis urceolata]